MGSWYHQKSCAEFVNSSSSEHIATREAPGSEHDSHSKLKFLVKHYSEFKTLFKGATLEVAASWETHNLFVTRMLNVTARLSEALQTQNKSSLHNNQQWRIIPTQHRQSMKKKREQFVFIAHFYLQFKLDVCSQGFWCVKVLLQTSDSFFSFFWPDFVIRMPQCCCCVTVSTPLKTLAYIQLQH